MARVAEIHYTWSYLLSLCQVELKESNTLMQNVFMNESSCVVEKWRNLQQLFVFLMICAQSFLGAYACIGVWSELPCQLKSNACAPTSHHIQQTEELNIFPFDVANAELGRHGIELKYHPGCMDLMITI